MNLRNKLLKCYIWNIAIYGAETCILRKVDQKYHESFEMWCWRRMEKIRRTDHVRYKAVLHRVKRGGIPYIHTRRETNWIGQILCCNCLLERGIEIKIEERIEVILRRGRRRKQLLFDERMRGYCKLKEEALYHTLWRTRFGRSYGPVVRDTAE